MKSVAKSPVLFATLLSCVLAGSAFAQSRPAAAARPAPTGGAIAVVDISQIFKSHVGFNEEMERMKTEVQQYEESLRTRHQALATERERLNAFKPGSAEYEKLERSMADAAAQLQIDTQMKKKEFLQRESKLYFDVYRQVKDAIGDFAQQKGIDIVLRYSSDEIDPDDRASVLQGVNQDLVYHNNLDITKFILDRVNRASVARRPAAKPAPRK
ncbi:MAG: OmpH family outer membrane protein [Planctomycetales bacterium]|nr:OmpH family outer membrane protein [Planctomycetales bacterium]MCA9171376.1 OmpH family outer membrane protein [Planctomycetales bacterium]